MKRSERICRNVNKDMKAQAVTLAEAVLAMQKKIDQQIPIFEKMPLAQQVTVGTGEKMLRQNPAIIEFRALVRDYSAALGNLQTIIQKNQKTEDEKVVPLVGHSKWKLKPEAERYAK